MIWHPRVGQAVEVQYTRRAAPAMPHHGKRGIVVAVARGPGPRNVGLVLEDGQAVVVPRGNVFRTQG